MTGVWALLDDRPGNRSQVLGVAEKLGVQVAHKELFYTKLASLPNLLIGARLTGLAPSCRTLLAPPWPSLVISAGRRSAPVARWIKKQNPAAKLVHIMKPDGGADEFDLLVIPEHDDARDATNVLRVTLPPHRLTLKRLHEEAQAWGERFAALPRPITTVLIGGSTAQTRFGDEDYKNLLAEADRLAAGGSLLITTSRRSAIAQVRDAASMVRKPYFLYLWKNGTENPFLAFLGLADRLVVTGESMSMCAEACFTGKPVHLFTPRAGLPAKYKRLHAMLFRYGLAMPLNSGTEGAVPVGPGDSPTQAPASLLDSAAQIAQSIRARGWA